MNIVNFFGIVSLVTSIIGLLPQIYKSFKTKSTKDISMLMLANYFICSISWIVYGLYTESQFVVLSNIVGLLTSFVSIFQKFYYDKNNNKS